MNYWHLFFFVIMKIYFFALMNVCHIFYCALNKLQENIKDIFILLYLIILIIQLV